jgi:hypothetical protein
MRQYLQMVLPALVVLLMSINSIESFGVGPQAGKIGKSRLSSNHHFNLIKSSEQQRTLSVPVSIVSTSLSPTQINANKKGAEPEREERTGFQLFLLYMTPWRNPNSIFVYLFGIVYLLGKYSEANIVAN